MTVSVVRYDMKVRQCFEGLKEDRILSVMTGGCNGLIRENSGHALKLYRDTLCQEERERTYQLRSQVFVSLLNGVFIVTK